MLTRAEIPGLIATLLLVTIGVSLAWWQWRSWARISHDPEEGTPARWAQCRRRIQIAGLIGVEGVLLCIGDTILPVLQRADYISLVMMASVWTIVVIVMLLVAVWITLLAFGDLAITMSQSRVEMLKIRQRGRTLQDEIERYRARHGDPDAS